jgi:hypothetical protein
MIAGRGFGSPDDPITPYNTTSSAPLKSAGLETLIDERLDIGSGDLNGRPSGLL